jgi:hypothetical protein
MPKHFYTIKHFYTTCPVRDIFFRRCGLRPALPEAPEGPDAAIFSTLELQRLPENEKALLELYWLEQAQEEAQED